MSHPLLLGAQVKQILRRGGHLDGHPLHDLQPEVRELVDLVRIVGEKPHGLHPQVPEDLGSGPVLPQVRGEAQLDVGVHRVQPLLLEGVGLELVDEADAPALLAHVQHHAPALRLDLPHGSRQLLAAVAALGAEHVPGEALGVDPAQDVLSVAELPLHQGHMVLSRQVADVAVDPEVAVPGGHFGHGLPDHVLVMAAAVVLKRLDGQHLQPPLLCLFQQLGGAHHGAVVPHDLTAQSARLQPRQAAQVHGGLRVAAADQHAAPSGHQGEHMAGPAQILWSGGRVYALAAGVAPLLGGDAGGGVRVVDGDCEGSTVVIGIHLHHLLQAQPVGDLLAHWGADQPLGLHGHEVDVLRGGELGRADQVPLVLPVRVVNGDDQAAGAKLLQSLLHGTELCLRIQEQLEHVCWQQGNRKQTAPAQRMGDFCHKKLSYDLPDSSYAPGLVSSPLHFWMPPFIVNRLAGGFRLFGRNARGFLTNEALMIGVETRTSSPVRIVRNRDTLQHVRLQGLFPCGEGAGYAGGIVSAAIDGERCAEAAARYCGVSVPDNL